MTDRTIDAKGKKLGRLASEIAVILQGKNSPSYSPHRPSHERVLVKNVEKLTVSGEKWSSNVRYRHTGYMGHLKSSTLEERFTKDPRGVLRDTVRHMLPKNSLAVERLKNLVFVENEND